MKNNIQINQTIVHFNEKKLGDKKKSIKLPQLSNFPSTMSEL